MPAFWYRAQSDPESTRRVLHAPSLPAAVLELRSRGESVAGLGAMPSPRHDRHSGVAEIDRLSFCRGLALLLRGGQPLPEALARLATDTPNPGLARPLRVMSQLTAEGAPLWEAMERFPRVFAPEVVAIARAAEASGDLASAFEGLAARGEAESLLADRLVLPMVYPLVVCGVAAALMSFAFSFLIPKFASLFSELGLGEDKLPLATLVLMRLSGAIPGFLSFLTILGLALAVVYVCYRRSAAGRIDLDYWRLRVPLLGQLSSSGAVARVCSTLGMLLEHRVPAPRALRLAGDASGSEALAAAFRRAQYVAEEGGSITESLTAARALPASFLWQLGAAEAGGKLPEALHRLGRAYVDATEFVARRAVAIVEPVAVLVLGVIVGGIVTGMFLPLISIISELSQ